MVRLIDAGTGSGSGPGSGSGELGWGGRRAFPAWNEGTLYLYLGLVGDCR